MKNGRKIISFITVLLTLALLISTFVISSFATEGAANQVTATTSASVKQGNTGYCYVYINSLEDVSSLSAAVHYDPESIEIISAYNSVSAEVYDSVIDDSFVQFSYVFDGKGENAKKQLFYFRYRVLSDAAPGKTYFDIVVNDAYDSAYETMEITGSRCSLEITEQVVNKTCSVSGSSSISSAINEEFELKYTLSSSYRIASGAFVINYDPELFEVVGITNGTFLKNATVDINTDLKGSIYISFIGESGKTYGEFVNVKFKTIKNTNETSLISFSSTDIYDENYDLVYCSGRKVNATVTYDSAYLGDAPDMCLYPEYSYENKQLTLTVKLGSESHLGAGDFTLTFDKNNFRYNSYVQGVEAYQFTVNDKNARNGILKISFISLVDLVDEETFITIVFDTPHFCEDVNAEFDIEARGLCDSMTNPIALNLVDGMISIPTITGHDIHSYDAKTATCTEIGWYAYEACSYCDYNTYVEIPATGHSITSHVAKEPTCIDIGWHAYENCSKCDYTTYVEIPENGHSYSTTVKEPTCIAQGYTLHNCSECGDSYIDSYVDALNHNLSLWTETKAPTCTENGAESRNCSRCDYYETRDVASTGHSHNAVITDPTCTESGYTTHTCHCGDVYVDNYTNALGHAFGLWTETKAATCTEKGTERRDCSRCEHYETRDIKTVPHSYTSVATSPTCTERGYTTYTCHCGDTYVDNYTYALGHDLSDWAEIKAPTCTEKGTERRDCSRCDYYETRDVNAIGHSHSAVVTKPTCTDRGYTTHTCHCGDTYVDNYTDALNHNLGSWTQTNAPTCIEKGTERRDCSICDYYEIRDVNAAGHSYSAEITAPTCTDKGYTTHTCHCGDTYVDNYTDALTHNLSAWTETKAPSCTEKGSDRRDCCRCDYYETRDINSKGHTSGDWIIDVEPTYKNNGRKHKECVVCYTILEESFIPMLTHSYVSSVVLPTCTEQGYTVHSCSGCGNTYVDNYTNALGHAFGSWTKTNAPTCTEKGTERRDCSRCEHYETRDIEIISHSYTPVVTNPTCTERGYTTYTCHCGDTYVDNYTDALTHNLSAWTETKAPSCTEKGTERRDCSRCDYYETRDVNAIGHSHNAVVTKPTCTDRGYTTHTCHCGDTYVDNYTDALGHDLSDWAEIKAPTCTEKGAERRDCTRCDYYETRDVAATDHSYNMVVINPTCADKGYTTHTCHCGEVYTDAYTNALGHELSDWVKVQAPTCIEEGTEERNCSRCDYFETRESGATGHSYTAVIILPTCSDRGYTTHTCHCGDVYVDNYTNALGHNLGDWVETQAPTCIAEGTERRKCSRCDYYETRNIACIAHSYELKVTAPTCTERGYTSHICTVCQDTWVDTYIDELSHKTVEWHETKAPTCTEKGTESGQCIRCDYSESRDIDALGHDIVTHAGKDPTATEDGWKEYETCTRCDHSTYEKIPALGTELDPDDSNNDVESPSSSDKFKEIVPYIIILVVLIVIFIWGKFMYWW